MNWFTKSNAVTLSSAQKKEKVEEWGGCEHVEKDNDLVYAISYENDPWGKEGFCLCKECLDKANEAEDNETVVCHDCSGTYKRLDTVSWKWYDFYAAQGDEPLTICKECKGKPKHQARVAKDRADYQEEFPD